jgi:hypothetical protein
MDALEIVAQQDCIHPAVRALLSCTSARLNELVKTTKIDVTKINFDSPAVCGTNAMTKTEALKLKVTEEDLNRLEVVIKYVACYRTYARYYDRKEVFALRLATYGSFFVKKDSLAREKRIKSLERIGVQVSHVGASHFLCNGKGGVRAVKENLKLYEQHDLPDEDWAKVFSGKTNLENALGIHQRTRVLVACLAEHSLSLRSDSRLCDIFIRGNIGNPQTIAAEMRIMHVLYSQTNYKHVLREMFNWDDDAVEISRRAKKKVMRDSRYKHLFAPIRSAASSNSWTTRR